MTNAQFDYLNGKIIAIQFAIKALIQIHPAADEISRAAGAALDQLAEFGISKDVSDELLKGIEESKRKLFP